MVGEAPAETTEYEEAELVMPEVVYEMLSELIDIPDDVNPYPVGSSITV